MHFALLGDHEDGLALARALAESGRHQLRCYSGPAVGLEYLRRWDLTAPSVPDLEEVLADPAVEAVIVASSPAVRAAQLRRALQSERHVLCVHPADQRADTAYEAATIRRETGCVLLPILPETLHPGLARLAELIAAERAAQTAGAKDVQIKAAQPVLSSVRSGQPAPHQRSTMHEPLPSLPRLIELEHWSTESLLHDANTPGHEPGIPGWEMLRVVAGEIIEVSAFGNLEEVRPDEPILLAGRFERGGLFHATLLPNQSQTLLRLAVVLRYHRAELLFPDGWPGPARLTWTDETGQPREERWDDWQPWPQLVEAFEQAVATKSAAPPLSWEDEVRCLELDDAARRSLERRRSSTLEFQEDFEEATFKGTMTLMGCALLWGSLFLLILSRWVWWLGWLIVPLFVVFLAMQFLRGVIPARESPVPPGSEKKSK